MEMSTLMRYYEGKLIRKTDDGHYVPFDARNLRSSLLHLMTHEARAMCSSMKTGDGFIPPNIQVHYYHIQNERKYLTKVHSRSQTRYVLSYYGLSRVITLVILFFILCSFGIL